jgi:hypothetical protein
MRSEVGLAQPGPLRPPLPKPPPPRRRRGSTRGAPRPTTPPPARPAERSQRSTPVLEAATSRRQRIRPASAGCLRRVHRRPFSHRPRLRHRLSPNPKLKSRPASRAARTTTSDGLQSTARSATARSRGSAPKQDRQRPAASRHCRVGRGAALLSCMESGGARRCPGRGQSPLPSGERSSAQTRPSRTSDYRVAWEAQAPGGGSLRAAVAYPRQGGHGRYRLTVNEQVLLVARGLPATSSTAAVTLAV